MLRGGRPYLRISVSWWDRRDGDGPWLARTGEASMTTPTKIDGDAMDENTSTRSRYDVEMAISIEERWQAAWDEAIAMKEAEAV